jgi:hypothetical protein
MHLPLVKYLSIKWRESELDGEDSSAQLEGGEYRDADSGRKWFNNYTDADESSPSSSDSRHLISVEVAGLVLPAPNNQLRN